jgi:hypothetical protein
MYIYIYICVCVCVYRPFPTYDHPTYDQPKFTKIFLRNFQFKLLSKCHYNFISNRMVFNNSLTNLSYFVEGTLFLLLCNKKTTYRNPTSPAGCCIFHLVSYFRFTTRFSERIVFVSCGVPVYMHAEIGNNPTNGIFVRTSNTVKNFSNAYQMNRTIYHGSRVRYSAHSVTTVCMVV